MIENYPGYEPDQPDPLAGARQPPPESDTQVGAFHDARPTSELPTPPPLPPGIPPPPPQFNPQSNRSFMSNMLRGLGIALLGCVAVIAGLAGACFMMLGGMTTTDGLPYIVGSSLVFAAAVIALIFLIRPRIKKP